jgi:hypothetical protein
MKGFLHRDLLLMRFNLIWGLIIFALFQIFAALGKSSIGSMAALFYLALVMASGTLGLFSLDEANHWQTYAAATPNGRENMVNGRYALALVEAALVVLVGTLAGLWGGGGLSGGLLYAGNLFVYMAVLLPLGYRFGMQKVRILMIGFLAVLAGLMGFSIAIGELRDWPSLRGLSAVLVPLGALALTALSWRISRAIMAKKDL